MNAVLIGLVVVVIIGAVILRQLKGEALRGRRVVLLPAVLIVIGVVNLHGSSSLKPVDIACIVASSVVAIAIGLGQGLMMHLESRNGGLWGRMPARGLWWWAALIASRGVVFVVAQIIGAKTASSVDSILLVLGLNRLAQALVIGARAMSAGVAFAPEKDGRCFLSGVLGNASTNTSKDDATISRLDRATWSGLARQVTGRDDQAS